MISLIRSYGKKRTFSYLIIMALLNFVYVFALYTDNSLPVTASFLNTAFAIMFLIAMLLIYYKNSLFVNKPILIKSILTQTILLVLLYALDYTASGLFQIPIGDIHDFFISPLIFMIVAVLYAAFALLFANIINFLSKQSSGKK